MWTYQGNVVEEIPPKAYGFVYRITNKLNGKMYIGRKYFYTHRKPRNKKRRVRAESNWRDYYGSSKKLLEDIEKYGLDNFQREIISFHETKGQVNYTEVAMQFKEDVLYAVDDKNRKKYYNENILSRYFSPKELID